MMNKSAHMDRFVDTNEGVRLLAPRERTRNAGEPHLSLKFWGLMAAGGFSLFTWIMVFRVMSGLT